MTEAATSFKPFVTSEDTALQAEENISKAVQAAAPKKTAEPAEVRGVVMPGKPKRRHYFMALSFLGCVVVPSLVTAGYLYFFAVDQYASTVGFSIRAEQTGGASSLLGGFSSLVGSSTTQDTDVLYEFIQSQDMVSRIDKKLNLRKMYSNPAIDPIYRFTPDGTIEELRDYWAKMVSIAYDSSSGLIQIQVRAFSPKDAQAIAQALHEESSRMINDLATSARADATRYALEDLDTAEARLKTTRAAKSELRSRTQIVDPTATVQSQMGILSQLQSQMAAALIQLDLLRVTTKGDDPRISDAELKISVIENRIAEERKKFGTGGQGIGDEDFSTVVAEFEQVTLEESFAERAYVAALTSLDASKAEAQRQSRYLATFVHPTLAETSEFPRRGLTSAMTLMFLGLIWAVCALIYYSVRDRR